jgi:hypothetical protein
MGYWTNRLAEITRERALDNGQTGQNGQNPPAKPSDAAFGQFGQIVQCPEAVDRSYFDKPIAGPADPETSLQGRDGFDGSACFVSSSGQVFPKLSDTPAEAVERASSIPRGYTRAEMDTARRDAERLGYGRPPDGEGK